jgi:hypothetical protein
MLKIRMELVSSLNFYKILNDIYSLSAPKFRFQFTLVLKNQENFVAL